MTISLKQILIKRRRSGIILKENEEEYLRLENSISWYYDIQENHEYENEKDREISRLHFSVPDIIFSKRRNNIELDEDEIAFNFLETDILMNWEIDDDIEDEDEIEDKIEPKITVLKYLVKNDLVKNDLVVHHKNEKNI